MSSFFRELKRRNVVRVAIAYIIMAWLLLQVIDVMLQVLGLPESVGKFMFLLLIVGFPLALFFAWAFELTPEGLKREKDVDRTQSITPHTGRKLDRVIISVLVLAVGFLLFDKFFLQRRTHTEVVTTDEARGKSVAVLPFANRSASEEDAFFVDGIHDDILTQLAKIGDLKVISRTSVMQYRDTTKTIREIGEELGVATVLEGGVQRAGDRVRINTQLIDAATDEHLWAESYDRSLTTQNIFAIQGEMASAIASALLATLTPEEEESVGTSPTDNIQAYETYLHAIALRKGTRVQGLDQAIMEFERAVELDPQFALAFVALSKAYMDRYWFVTRDPADREASQRSIDTVLELAPDLPEAHLQMAEHLYHGFLDYDGALAELRIAEQRLPNNAEMFMTRGAIERRKGQWESALESFERAMILDPRNADHPFELASTHAALRQFDIAERYFNRASRISPVPSVSYAIDAIGGVVHIDHSGSVERLLEATDEEILTNVLSDDGKTYMVGLRLDGLLLKRDYEAGLQLLDKMTIDIYQGQDLFIPKQLWQARFYRVAGNEAEAVRLYEETMPILDTAVAERPDEPSIYVSLAETHANLGMKEEALAAAGRAMELLPITKDYFAGGDYYIAYVDTLVAVGEFEKAVEGAEYLLSIPSNFSLNWTELDPRWDGIREFPPYQQLLKKHGISREQRSEREAGSGKREVVKRET